MPYLDMKGPFLLSSVNIDSHVQKNKMGNYALGKYDSEKNTFIVSYVGRSDSDLNKRLHDHIGESTKYTHFMYSFATSKEAAYNKECTNWHDFGGAAGHLDNKIHPDKPRDNSRYSCPICKK